MPHAILGVFAIAVWLAVPTVCAWFLVDGLRKGVVRAKLGSYSRSDDPIWYWGCLAMYGGLIVWFLYLSARVALDV